MHKTLRTARIGLTEDEVIFDEIADILETAEKLAGDFRTQHVRTEIQQEVYNLIQTAQIPEGQVLHLLLHGSIGSGKTWCALSYITEVLLDYPGATALGARRTYNEIEDAMFSTFERFLSKYNIPYRTNKKYTTITLNNGSVIRMRSADKVSTSKSDKADYLGGTEYSVAILDEADEIPEEFAKTVAGRMREAVGVKRKVIFYICNPPSQDHWLYRWFYEEHDPDDPESRYRSVWMPVQANVEHVGQAYIDSIHEDYADNPALYLRMVQGKFGPAVKGYPIFGQYFNRDIHIAKTEIHKNWNKRYPIWISFDFGWRRPAALVFQDDRSLNQIRILREWLGSREVLDSFADRVLDEVYTLFPGAEIMCSCDPAGKQRTDKSLLNSIDILKSKGLRPKYKKTAIEYGVNIIAELLSRFIPSREGPIPAIILDPSCEILADALEFGYCQEKARIDGGTFDEEARRPIKVVKDGYYEHLGDCLRYGMIFVRRPNQAFRPSYTRHELYKSIDRIDNIERGNFNPSKYVRAMELYDKRRLYGGNYSFSRQRRHF